MMAKKPTMAQKKIMTKWHLNHRNWLVQREMPREMWIVHRHTGTARIIPEGKNGRREERQAAI